MALQDHPVLKVPVVPKVLAVPMANEAHLDHLDPLVVMVHLQVRGPRIEKATESPKATIGVNSGSIRIVSKILSSFTPRPLAPGVFLVLKLAPISITAYSFSAMSATRLRI